MTKIVRVLLAVAAIAVVILIFTVGYDGHSSPESGRIGINATERARHIIGLLSNLAPFDASWSPRWLSDGVIRIVPILGANLDFLRPYRCTTKFGNSIKVSVDDTLSDGEFGSATEYRYSYETGIRVYLSPMQYVGIIYGKRYEGDSVTTSLETGIRL